MRRTMRDAAAILTVGVLAVGVAASAHAQVPDARGLAGLARLAVEVTLPRDLAELKDDLERRLARALSERAPALALDPRSRDRLRLVVRVRAENATELRGFWLPFSGTYAIGFVRLEIERPLTPAGAATASDLPAIVWSADEIVAGPWREATARVAHATESLARALADEWRRRP